MSTCFYNCPTKQSSKFTNDILNLKKFNTEKTSLFRKVLEKWEKNKNIFWQNTVVCRSARAARKSADRNYKDISHCNTNETGVTSDCNTSATVRTNRTTRKRLSTENIRATNEYKNRTKTSYRKALCYRTNDHFEISRVQPEVGKLCSCPGQPDIILRKQVFFWGDGRN